MGNSTSHEDEKASPQIANTPVVDLTCIRGWRQQLTSNFVRGDARKISRAALCADLQRMCQGNGSLRPMHAPMLISKLPLIISILQSAPCVPTACADHRIHRITPLIYGKISGKSHITPLVHLEISGKKHITPSSQEDQRQTPHHFIMDRRSVAKATSLHYRTTMAVVSTLVNHGSNVLKPICLQPANAP